MESLTDDAEWSPLLDELQKEGSCVQVDSWSLAVEPNFLQTLHKDLIKQQDVIYELIQTEFHHVRTLRIMEGVYRRGMLEEVMLEAGVVHTIFPCLDQLLELHSHFLSELLNRRKAGLVEGSSTNFTVRKLGDLLVRQVRRLHLLHPHLAANRASKATIPLQTKAHQIHHIRSWYDSLNSTNPTFSNATFCMWY